MGQREEETTIAVATFSSIRRTVDGIQLTMGARFYQLNCNFYHTHPGNYPHKKYSFPPLDGYPKQWNDDAANYTGPIICWQGALCH